MWRMLDVEISVQMTTFKNQCGRETRSVSHRQRARRLRPGAAAITLLIMLTALLAMTSLGVDYARVQLVKTELQRVADAAARYGAMGLGSGPSTARANAKSVAAQNIVDGTAVVLQDSDIEMGTWNAATRTFTVLTGSSESSATAVRVTAARTASRGNAVVVSFARVLGRTSCDATTKSIAFYSFPVDSVTDVPATSNPWLAGMPNGTIANPGNPHNNPDTAPNNVPANVMNLPIIPGQALTFDSINGGANNFQSDELFNPDGNTGWIVSNFSGNEHGKSDLTAPINAVIGVFLTDDFPTSDGAVPTALDFSTEAARDFQSLSPKLRQPFFIGDGKRSDNSTQQFIIPQGATRLYIGIMDGYEWNNNVGKYITTIHRIGQVTTVK